MLQQKVQEVYELVCKMTGKDVAIVKIDDQLDYVIEILSQNQTDYQGLEKQMQKYEGEIRKHIRMEQQIKLYAESLQQKLEEQHSYKQATTTLIAALKKSIADHETTIQHLQDENRQLRQRIVEAYSQKSSPAQKRDQRDSKTQPYVSQTIDYTILSRRESDRSRKLKPQLFKNKLQENYRQFLQTYNSITIKSKNQRQKKSISEHHNKYRDDKNKLTAYEAYKKIESEIKFQTNLLDKPTNLAKCTIHQTNYSKNCRQCKKIQESRVEVPQYFEKSVNMDKYYYDTGDRGNNQIPIHGNSALENMNALLRQNIQSSTYYRELLRILDINDLIAEIEKNATNVEPWALGGQGMPSSIFCCLHRLMSLSLTVSQLKLLLDYRSNPFVRCVGLLYVRYAVDPNFLWGWMKKYILDEQELIPTHNERMTIGEFVEKLLTDQNYYNTRLPRIPQHIETIIQANIVLYREKRSRASINIRITDLFTKGVQVRAISQVDDEWHVGEVQQFIDNHLYIMFPEFEKVEQVSLGDIEYIPQCEQQATYIATKIQQGIQEGNIQIDIPLQEEQIPIREVSKSKSISSSRSKSKSHKKHKKHHKKRKRSSSRSSSSSSSKSRKKHKKDKKKHKNHKKHKKNKKSEEKQLDISQKYESNKERQERLQREIRQKQMDKAVTASRQDFAKIPVSYKTSLSVAFPHSSKSQRPKSPSPIKKREQFIELGDKQIKNEKQKLYQGVEVDNGIKEKYGNSGNMKINLDQGHDKINNDYV